ncbi:hypothetical protein R3P38DRAFT_192477 [Favolaschia claudopus]|uniref:Secreted protein n=1 Tax=Favolaschia claudopus TaxID=2862362 RepID=A0AAV9ZTV0_9AGAR
MPCLSLLTSFVVSWWACHSTSGVCRGPSRRSSSRLYHRTRRMDELMPPDLMSCFKGTRLSSTRDSQFHAIEEGMVVSQHAVADTCLALFGRETLPIVRNRWLLIHTNPLHLSFLSFYREAPFKALAIRDLSVTDCPGPVLPDRRKNHMVRGAASREAYGEGGDGCSRQRKIRRISSDPAIGEALVSRPTTPVRMECEALCGCRRSGNRYFVLWLSKRRLDDFRPFASLHPRGKRHIPPAQSLPWRPQTQLLMIQHRAVPNSRNVSADIQVSHHRLSFELEAHICHHVAHSVVFILQRPP